MKISHGTRIKNINDTNGYGYATTNMIASLRRLGYEVDQNDPTADVEIWFDQPHHWNFSKGPYRIGYHPWESTNLPTENGKWSSGKDWAKVMNECDEIWTPSPLIADWYTRYAGITKPVYVYEHGVDPIWTPKLRKVDNTIRFMHIGGEAVRKGLPETMAAFRRAFYNHHDVSLTVKVIADGWNLPSFNRINVVNRALGLTDLIQMYHDHHAFVYPSWGEGFGLTPIQAMATAMPTIIPGAWAPYERFLLSELNLPSRLAPSPWPDIHPGMMLRPNTDELVDRMRYLYHNYDAASRDSYDLVRPLMDYYNWDKLTQTAFEELADRLQK